MASRKQSARKRSARVVGTSNSQPTKSASSSGAPRGKRGARNGETKEVAAALSLARAQAAEVLSLRTKAIRARARTLATKATVTRDVSLTAAVTPTMLRAVGGAATAGVLIAEGDSWFDYPWADILSELEDRYGYDIESVAKAGDRVEDMAYNGGQLTKFVRAIEKVVRRGSIPRAILLSGGGNDIAGREFAVLLNHAQSASPGLNMEIVEALIHGRLRDAYIHILESITSVTTTLMGQPTPMVVHGYGYPVPDGRGFAGGWWLLPGPWMEPGFRGKGYDTLQQRTDLAAALIDQFNAMLAAVVAMPNFAHVTYVDLRPVLSNDLKTYKTHWANELHPTDKGWTLVTTLIANAIP